MAIRSPAELTLEFIHDLRFEDLSTETVEQAKRCLLDLIGVAAGGRQTPLSHIIRDHAARHFGGSDWSARLIFDGRRASPVGCALAGGMTIDALDAHDGHPLTKGHIGCGVLPALLAVTESRELADGREFLTALVVGYEIGSRAGRALHASVPDYHTSGAWISLAAAAVTARTYGLSLAHTREALGIAEYHGPRSQMMRCIDHPSMLKDGSGWGAMAGVSAACLASEGFTGGPAITLEDEAQGEIWGDIGRHWSIHEQYFKAYPVCRWAQPAIQATLALVRENEVALDAIEAIEIETFHEATRLVESAPASTEQAQYSLPFPVATALVHGTVGSEQIMGAGLEDTAVLRLAQRVSMTESEAFNRDFPAKRWARATLRLADGQVLASEAMLARGEVETPLGDEALIAKFHALSAATLGPTRSALVERTVAELDEEPLALGTLLEELAAPPESFGELASAAE